MQQAKLWGGYCPQQALVLEASSEMKPCGVDCFAPLCNSSYRPDGEQCGCRNASAGHAPASHATARHATARHAPADHATARHAPAGHATARHAPAGHAPATRSVLVLYAARTIYSVAQMKVS